ncbi:kinetochore-associated protein DSN1 homolog isoform X3 [Dasypus novemcinctus]|uniref:kinetochore-associated protein DSN1 homolog isoform X3 n=1 Tax=Dasypus novemcinctus TaxID=9361 RepID=UPI0039C9E638
MTSVSRSETAEDVTQGVSKERNLGSSPKRGGSHDLSHQEGLQSRSLHLSPQEQSAHHQDRRQSWRRASMKETNRRKSLPPFHQGITELSRSISVNLAESKRLGSLLLSSFQFSVQKLEPFLKDTKDFSLESFRAKVSSLSEELKHFTDRLESDGTLQKCFESPKERCHGLNPGPCTWDVHSTTELYLLPHEIWFYSFVCLFLGGSTQPLELHPLPFILFFFKDLFFIYFSPLPPHPPSCLLSVSIRCVFFCDCFYPYQWHRESVFLLVASSRCVSSPCVRHHSWAGCIFFHAGWLYLQGAVLARGSPLCGGHP